MKIELLSAALEPPIKVYQIFGSAYIYFCHAAKGIFFQRNAILIKGSVAEAIKKLKQEPGEGLVQYGVGELTHTILKAGLVDEFRILVYPFTFGEGPRIFDHMGINTLKLLETRTFNSGVVALHYTP